MNTSDIRLSSLPYLIYRDSGSCISLIGSKREISNYINRFLWILSVEKEKEELYDSCLYSYKFEGIHPESSVKIRDLYVTPSHQDFMKLSQILDDPVVHDTPVTYTEIDKLPLLCQVPDPRDLDRIIMLGTDGDIIRHIAKLEDAMGRTGTRCIVYGHQLTKIDHQLTEENMGLEINEILVTGSESISKLIFRAHQHSYRRY